MTPKPDTHVLLAFPFRLFFLLVAIAGVISIPAWLGRFLGGWSLPVGDSPVHWHSHEMLFGLVTAAIAGFVLTAMCNWTGAAPLRRHKLLALGLLWLAGRAVMWTSGWLPATAVAAVDLLFLPVLAVYVSGVLRRHGNTRNQMLVVILGLLFLSNVWMHIGFITDDITRLQQGEVAALNVITLVIVVIAGRITPAFTANWLRVQGRDTTGVRTSPQWDRLTLLATALMIPADWIAGAAPVAGGVALTAALLNGIRLARWGGWQTLREPLLWILHLGYAWLVAALLLKGLAAFGLVAPSAWQHALGAGAMGTLILGVMTRVALGHTGRPLQLPRFAVLIYYAVTLAAAARLLTALFVVDYRTGLLLSATGWTLAFALFLIIYWPILTRPRVDGRPG